MDQEILQNINERLDKSTDNGQNSAAADELRERLEDLQGQAESIIRKHPVKAVAAGLLTGFLLAKIFRSGD